MVHDEKQNGAGNGHQQAVQVESGNTRHPKGGEEPAADDRTDDAENDIHYDSLTRPANNLAGAERGDKTEDDPCY